MIGGLALLASAPGAALAESDDDRRACVAGAPGVGDRYYPGYGNGGYDVRIALAERVAGRELDELFTTWLFTAGKPALPAAQGVSAASSASAPAAQAGRATAWLDQLSGRLRVGRY